MDKPYDFALYADLNEIYEDPIRLLRKAAYNVKEVAIWYYDVYCCQQGIVGKRKDYAGIFEDLMSIYENYRNCIHKLEMI